jgi:RNA polymerase sigma factor (sigma-70 family)
MDDQQLAKAYVENRDIVTSFIKRKINHTETQNESDVYQETWIRFLNLSQKPTFELKSKLSTLLIGIAENVIKEGFRSKATHPLEDAFAIFLEVDDTLNAKIEQENMLQRMEQNFALLGENCKKIIEQFYFEAKSHQQIMEAFGYNTREVSRNTLTRCIDNLRKKIFPKP